MNKNVKNFARRAGFCFWSNESHRPENQIIDWSSNYDKEFVKYTNMIIADAIKLDRAGADVYTYYGLNEENQEKTENIEIQLNDDELLVLMQMAHERNLTFNKFVNDLLRDHMADLK